MLDCKTLHQVCTQMLVYMFLCVYLGCTLNTLIPFHHLLMNLHPGPLYWTMTDNITPLYKNVAFDCTQKAP